MHPAISMALGLERIVLCTEPQKTKPVLKWRRDYAEIQAQTTMLHRLKFREHLNYKWNDFMDSALWSWGKYFIVCCYPMRLTTWIPEQSSRSGNLKVVIEVWNGLSVWLTVVDRCLGPSLWGMVFMEVGRCSAIQYYPITTCKCRSHRTQSPGLWKQEI